MSFSGAGSSVVSSLESSGGLLAELRASRQREAAEQVRQVWLGLEFCAFSSPDSLAADPARRAATVPGTEGEVALAGPGAPQVAEFAVVEFGAVAGMSTDAARRFLGRCLELGHRLPAVWKAAQRGQVAAWRALRVAEHTMGLPVEGAAWVDAQVAPVVGRVGPVVLQRLVEEAVARFDPEAAALAACEALESRHATITLETALASSASPGIAIGRLEAVLEAADALDLDAALADLAADLKEAGDGSPVEVRRARALGLLARGETIDTTPTQTSPGTNPGVPSPGTVGPARGRRREVVVHVHLTDEVFAGAGDGIARVRTGSGRRWGQITIEQVQAWCGTAASVTVKPVLDLAATITSGGYRPSTRLREQVTGLNPTCVFPYCQRPSLGLDLDHIWPYATGGATTSSNLAPLCRRHHRAKTHTGWSYTRLGPAEHHWTSPHGYQWITHTEAGTTQTTPTTPAAPAAPAAPPGLSTGPP